jgi:hypothetical protein
MAMGGGELLSSESDAEEDIVVSYRWNCCVDCESMVRGGWEEDRAS